MSKNLPAVYGNVVIAELKKSFSYPPKDGRGEPSLGYEVQIPYADGARVNQRIYLPRDASVKPQQLDVHKYYAFPVTLRVGNGGKSISFTMAAPAVEAPQ